MTHELFTPTDDHPLMRALGCYEKLANAHIDAQDPYRHTVRELGDALMELHAGLDWLRRQSRLVPGTCEQCGQGMPVLAASGRRRRYCSDACRQAAYRKRRTPLQAERNPDGWYRSGSPTPDTCARFMLDADDPCTEVGVWRAEQRRGDDGTWATFWCDEHLPDEYRAVTDES